MLITNGLVFTGKEFRKGLQVRLENGTVAEVGENLALRNGEEQLDLGGDYLLPGFVDVHIHAFMGKDTMEGEEAVRAMSRGLAKLGVAAFCPTTMSASLGGTREALKGIRAAMEAPEKDGTRVLGAHMEAPFLNPSYKGAQREECLMAPSAEAYGQLTRGIRCVRMMTLAPELPGATELIRTLAARGIVTCAAHSGASAEDIHAAADAGLTQITHLFTTKLLM